MAKLRNVRAFRLKKDMSQKQLAFECDLHRTYISDIERDQRSVSIDNIEKLALALSVFRMNSYLKIIIKL